MMRRVARPTGDRGAVTAELAVALPVIVLMLLAILVVTAASTAQMRSADAARAAARALAIGETESQAHQIVSQLAGSNAQVSIANNPPWVTAVVTKPVAGGWFSAGPLQARAEAVAKVEP